MKKSPPPYIWSHLKPYRAAFAGIGCLLFVQMFLTVLSPLPLKYILNHLLKGKSDSIHNVTLNGWNLGAFTGADALLTLTAIGLSIGVAITFSFWWEQVWTGRLMFRINENIRRDFFLRIFSRQQAYLDSKKKVDLLGRISGDVANLEALLTTGLSAIVRDGPMIFVLLLMMFLVDFKLTLMFSVCLPIFYLLGHFFTKKMRLAYKNLRRKTVTFEEESYEALNSMAIVKSLRGEDKIQQKLFTRTSEITQLSRNSLHASMGLEVSMEFSQGLVKGLFLFVGCWAIFKSEVGLGDVFQLISYMGILTKHVNNVNKFVSKYPKCNASMVRLEELNAELALFPEISGSIQLNSEMLRSAKNAISFKGVDMSYENGRSILSSYSFDIPKAKLIAVVGPSGVGKSTYSRLLNRLLDPKAGHLEIAGHDLREFDVKSLRSLVRTISQETFLTSGSVRENLLLAVARNVSDEEIFTALEKVNGAEFIRKLPLGLNTIIGEGGLQLSGGEAQRVHLARAFLDLDSEIILFDEPTTGLDTASAEKVIQSIMALSRKKSLVFWVTHRMQEVHSADHVLFFQREENPLFATHEELFKTNFAYRELMSGSESSPLPKTFPPLKLVSLNDSVGPQIDC